MGLSQYDNFFESQQEGLALVCHGSVLSKVTIITEVSISSYAQVPPPLKGEGIMQGTEQGVGVLEATLISTYCLS